ncbi:glycosyltransferase family 9 protein [Acetobacter sp. AN02]|uniref:glycosyltransferase family 9 protein n=1 Tax=Acetobacter sp. AN02 TaxID=2894186 RepID=UPI0024345990|nr:glycosyltransferase family 9 protein [Acetobacter sp. AN02]MDG6094818.1 glycosyltransferase family 9 protein [Acetobacter sp. AN02]
MRILFITSTRLGDAVISTGLLRHLLATYPSARFTVACGPVAAGVFERMPRLERVIVMEKQRFDLHWLALWRRCVTSVWDLVVDLRGSGVSWCLLASRRMIVRGGRRPGLRLAHLGAAFGLTPPPLPQIWTAPEDQAVADAVTGQPEAEDMLIGLGPTANWSGKIWPAERFISLWHGLREARPGARLAVFYGPGRTERKLAAPLLALPEAIDAGGRFSLAETAAMLSRCAFFVGNDSGLMHLSAAAGTPTLGLFGPSRVSEYAPSGPHAFSISAPGPEGEAPIAGLAADEVLEKALDVIGGRACG